MFLDDDTNFLAVLIATGISIVDKTDSEIAELFYKKAKPTALYKWALEEEGYALTTREGAETVARFGFKGVDNFESWDYLEILESKVSCSDTDELIELYNELTDEK